MYTDLICFDAAEKLEDNFGFSRFIRVNIIDAMSQQDLERKIRPSSESFVVVQGSELNRLVLENKNIDLLVSPEKNRNKDFMHYRNSGLNQVLCKLAHKNGIAIAFSFNEILKSKGTSRSRIIGRIMQNIRLCRKYKLKMVLASFALSEIELRNSSDLISLGIVLGMTPKEAKESLSNVNALMEEKRDKISGGVKARKIEQP